MDIEEANNRIDQNVKELKRLSDILSKPSSNNTKINKDINKNNIINNTNNGNKNISSNINNGNINLNNINERPVDSNLKIMNPDIMNDQATCAKLYCPNIEQIIYVIDSALTLQQSKKDSCSIWHESHIV